jgi:serine/threonine protein phosphatase PrpC
LCCFFRSKTGCKRLSFDHKPKLPEETERITANGGFVAMGRVNGFFFSFFFFFKLGIAVLAVSGAFGDHGLKSLVISEPYLSFTERTSGIFN